MMLLYKTTDEEKYLDITGEIPFSCSIRNKWC